MTGARREPAGPSGIEQVDRVIHEPARLLIVSHLYVLDAADFVFLSRQTGLTGGNLSSHLSKLETAGYVAVEKSFVGKRPQTLLRLTDRGRDAFRRYRLAMTEVLGALPGDDAGT